MIFKQILEGIDFCHKLEVAHRDIKLENILTHDSENQVKIIDFGFSTLRERKMRIFCGTPSYMAPEIIQKKEYLGQAADIWALGILLYAMLQGSFPFKGATDSELYKKILAGNFSFQIG